MPRRGRRQAGQGGGRGGATRAARLALALALVLALVLAMLLAAGHGVLAQQDVGSGGPPVSASQAQERLAGFEPDLGTTPGIPAAPAPDALSRETAAAYEEALRAYYDYRMAGYEHRLAVFQWQDLSTKIIFTVVLVLVFLGMYFAAIQFHVGLRRRPPPGPGLPPDAYHPYEEPSEIALSLKGFKVRSPVLGVIVLTISLAFFYLYLVYVYPIRTVF